MFILLSLTSQTASFIETVDMSPVHCYPVCHFHGYDRLSSHPADPDMVAFSASGFFSFW